MAGIGFALRKSVTSGAVLGSGRAYLSAVVVSCGPWLLSTATLVGISLFTTALAPRERDVLFAAIMYAFALSLIGIGPIQMAVTRYLADMVYLEKLEAVGPAFVGTAIAWLALLSIPLAAMCLALTDLSVPFRLVMMSLFIGAAGTWIALIYLAAVHDYVRVVRAFLFGYSLGGFCALLAGPAYGATGYLLGFSLGQLLVFGILSATVLTEFEVVDAQAWHFRAFTYVLRYPSLVVVGVAYNLALWADKAMFWYARTGTELVPHVRVAPSYDVAVFLSSIAAVPASAVFLVHVETVFYERYRAFYDAIGAKRPLMHLRQMRYAINESLRQSFLLLVKIQLVVVLVGLVLADGVYSVLGLPKTEVVVFQNLIIASGTQVLLLVSVLVLLYFDLRSAAVVTSVTFLFANVAFTLATLSLGPSLHGLGYAGAALSALVLSQVLLWRHLAQLEFHTFTRQPIGP